MNNSRRLIRRMFLRKLQQMREQGVYCECNHSADDHGLTDTMITLGHRPACKSCRCSAFTEDPTYSPPN